MTHEDRLSQGNTIIAKDKDHVKPDRVTGAFMGMLTDEYMMVAFNATQVELMHIYDFASNYVFRSWD